MSQVSVAATAGNLGADHPEGDVVVGADGHDDVFVGLLGHTQEELERWKTEGVI